MAVQDKLVNLADLKTAYDATVHTGAQSLTTAQAAQARANVGAQARIEPDGAIALDLTDSVAAYPSGNVGGTISYRSSTATTTYKNAAWVQAGCEYALTIVNGETIASDANRVSMVIDTNGTVLQTLSTPVVASQTIMHPFVADADGLLVISVDVNAVSVSLEGGLLSTFGTASPVSPEAFSAEIMGTNDGITVNGKAVRVRGNYVFMRGTAPASGSSTYAYFNVAGEIGGVSGTISEAGVKSLFADGKYYAIPDGFMHPDSYDMELRVSYNKISQRPTPQEWGWSLYLYTYNADTDTLTTVYGYDQLPVNVAREMTIPLQHDRVEIMKANGNFALVLYARGDAQRIGNMIELRWSLVPIIRENYHGVDYGFFRPQHADETENHHWTMDRVGNIFRANSSAPTDSGTTWGRLTNALGRATSSGSVRNWNNGVKLIDGHLYIVRSTLISGDVTNTDETYPYVSVYPEGASSTIGIDRSENNNKSRFWRVFRAGADPLVFAIVVPGGTTFINAVYDIWLEDITDTDIQVAESAPVLKGIPGASYVCGTLDSLTFTPCASGLCSVRFTSGTTATVLTGVDNVKWPAWFDPSALSTNTVYELNISDGEFGVVGTWAT